MKHRNRMMIDLPRFLVYAALGVLSYLGQVPWFMAPLALVYDLRYFVTIPWFGHHEDQTEAFEKYVKQLQQQRADSMMGQPEAKKETVH